MIRCIVCGKEFEAITFAHLKKHNMTFGEYIKLYPDAPLWSEENRRRQSKIITIAWDDGKFDERDHTKIADAMRNGWTEEHDLKIAQSVKELYEKDTRKQYGFRAVKHHPMSDETKRKLANCSLKQWENMSPEEQEEKIKKLRKGLRKKMSGTQFIEFEGKLFYHQNEILCYEFLKRLGLRKEDIEVNFPIKLKEIDFFVSGQFFWEHHICNVFDGLTKEEYFEKRRRVLDDNGFKGYPLLVTTSNKELNEDLEYRILELLGDDDRANTPEAKQFYKQAAAEFVDFCKAHGIRYHVKSDIFRGDIDAKEIKGF